jgi:hypothetical protein
MMGENPGLNPGFGVLRCGPCTADLSDLSAATATPKLLHNHSVSLAAIASKRPASIQHLNNLFGLYDFDGLYRAPEHKFRSLKT